MARKNNIEVFDFTGRNLGELSRLTHAYFTELQQYDDAIHFAEGWETYYRHRMESGLGAPHFFVRGLRMDKEAVGFIMFGYRDEPMWRKRRRGYLSNIYVVPAHRRRGLGNFMVKGALQTLRQMDVEVVELDVYVTNDTGRRFWESFGFSPFKQRLRLNMT